MKNSAYCKSVCAFRTAVGQLACVGCALVSCSPLNGSSSAFIILHPLPTPLMISVNFS